MARPITVPDGIAIILLCRPGSSRQVAALRNPDDPYSSGLANYFTAKFKEMGGSVVADQSYREGYIWLT